MIYGKYNLHITNTDGMDEQLSVFNHITRAGLNYLLRGEPKPLQPTLTAAGLGKDFAGKLNFMFFHVRPADMSRTVAEEDIYDIEFPDITDPKVRYTFIGKDSVTPLYSFTGDDDIIIDGIGIGYYEIGGTGENNFIFSYTHIDNGLIRRDLYEGRFGWQVVCEYTINNGNNSLMPSAKFNIGGIDYEFRPTVYRSVGYFQNTVTQSGGLFLENGAKEWSIDNAALNKTTFQWAINGKPCVPANSFEELTIQNEKTKKASRVFRVKYKNNKPFAVHVTGFKLSIGAFAFAYRAEVGKYIVLPAGKTITLNLSAEIFNGKVGTPTTSEFGSKYMATREIDPDYLHLEEDTVSNIIATVYEGTSKEKVTVTPNRDGYTNYLNAIGNNDTLTKYVFQYLDGSRSTPIYLMKDASPSSYSFAKPQVTSADGWVVNEDDVCFRISAPSNVNFIEFASIDGVWERFAVTPNAVNFIKLSAKFLYEPHMYIRWASATATGLILVYEDRTFAGSVNVPIEFVYGETGNPHLVLYPSRTAGNSPIGYTTSATYVEGTTPLTTAVIGSNPDYYALDAPYGFGWFTSDAKFMGPLPNSKWFDPINMKLVAIPRYDEVYPYSRHDVTKSENPLIREKYNITPVKSNEVSGHLADSHPKVKNLALVKKPTETKKQVITGYLSGLAKGIELFNSVSNEVLASYTGKEGSFYTLEHITPMYDHIPYGLRYLDELGQNISSGKEYYIYGIELAPPEPVEDVYYDADQQLLTFVTPERATRATIKRWGIELYSFECVKDGTTTLYSSEVFNAAGNYILTLYNSEGIAGESIYIFGYNDNDVAIKPDTTGPYSFSDWSFNSSNYSGGNDLPFLHAKTFDERPELYKVLIDGYPARVAEVKRNDHGIIENVTFESQGNVVRWYPGYMYYNDTYDTASSNTNLSVLLGSSRLQVVAYHDWELYSDVGIDKFGKISSSKYTPVYGKSTSYYQFSEVSTGYIRNSLKVLLSKASYSSSYSPYYLDSTFVAKSPTANAYIHVDDIRGSTRFKENKDSRSWLFSHYHVYINGVIAERELTLDETDAIIKIRCYTDEAAFIYDTANPIAGWVLEGYDPELIGHPDYADLVYCLDFYTSNKYGNTGYLGSSPTSTGVYGNNQHIRHLNEYYREQMSVRVAPYMALLTYEEDTGKSLESQPYYYSDEPRYNENARWGEIYIQIDPSDLFNNVTAIIDGKVATITSSEVTLPFNVVPNSLLTTTQLEKPYRYDNYTGISVNQEPYTYTAYTLTTDTCVISNTEHPYIFKVKQHDYTNVNDDTIVRLVIVRNKILQNSITLSNWNAKTSNVVVDQSLQSDNGYSYSYMTALFYLNYPKVMKYSDTPRTLDTPDDQIPLGPVNNLYLLNALVENIIWEGYVPEEVGFRHTNFITVNDEKFDLIINQEYIDYVDSVREEGGTSYGGKVYELVNTDNSKTIIGYGEVHVEYIGFDLGTSILIKFSAEGSDSELINDLMSEFISLYNNTNDTPMNALMEYSGIAMLGYNSASFWNYVPHQIPSGKVGVVIRLQTLIPEEGEYVEDFIPKDRSSMIQENSRNQTVSEYGLHLDSRYVKNNVDEDVGLSSLFDNFSAECNGYLVDTKAVEIFDEVEVIALTFNELKLKVIVGLYQEIIFLDSETLNEKDPELQYILKLVTKGLSITNNDSLLMVIADGVDVLNPLYTMGNVVVFDDYNGTERYQSIYICYGIKPRAVIEIDPRIGNSPFPEYGSHSFTYIHTSENNAEH